MREVGYVHPVERQGDDPDYAAIDAILGLHGDGVIVEMDLDDDNGTLQWEVGFDREDGSDGPEVEIDATSGEVLTVDER